MSPTDKLHGSGNQQVKVEWTPLPSTLDDPFGGICVFYPGNLHRHCENGGPGFRGNPLPGNG